MAEEGGYLFFARMDVEPQHEADFNEIYDTEHIPELMKVPGVRKVTRFKLDSTLYTTEMAGQPTYIAVYEVDSPDVVHSEAWGIATELGNWKDKVRPYTSNRSHLIYKRL